MAITTNTVSIAGTWTKVNLLEQLGEGLEWLGWHSIAGGGSSETGKVCGFQTFYGGGSLANADPKQPEYQDVFPIATTGIGTGASFLVQRCPLDGDNGSGVRVVDAIMANRPGYGYTGGEVVTLSAEDIGGSSNGATNITIPVVIESDITGGNSYICTFTGSSPITMEAYGRNGFVSGSCTNTYVEIQEGDTITFDNNTGAWNMALCWRNHPIENTLSHEYTNENRVFNASVFNNGGTGSFTPISGQAGKYFFREDSSDIRTLVNNDVGNVIVTAATSGISTVGFGTTNSWYHVDYSNTSYPWAVWRQSFDENKKFGTTYRLFGINNTNSSITQWVGNGWQHSTRSEYLYHSGGHGRGMRFAGANGLDNGYGGHMYETYATFESGLTGSNVLQAHTNASLTHGGTTNKALDLNIYRSGIDPDFAVFSYYEPDVSATRWDGRSVNAWFFHNFSQSVWDLDECFTSGTTFIDDGGQGGVNPYITFSTQVGGTHRTSYDDYPARRSGEFGYSSIDSEYDFNNFIVTDYYSQIVPARSSTGANPADEMRIYHRSTNSSLNQKDLSSGSGGTTGQDTVGVDFNPVIKGIPISGKMVPCPYYIPDDFVLIDFFYASSNEFIDQGDTITISGSEVYTIIVASYYQGSGTAGIAFCARTT
jgi:hypothetical protein